MKPTYTAKKKGHGRCGSCAFAIKSKGSLACHARPPLASREGGYAVWPLVRATWVCAGYRSNTLFSVQRIEVK